MDAATLSLAFGAGALAALNPCGFALLPAYLSLTAAAPAPSSNGTRPAWPALAGAVGRAVGAAAVMTVGFVVVFGVFGLIVAPLASSSQEALPYVTAASGVLLLAVGVVLLSGREVKVPMPALRRGSGHGLLVTLGYGGIYALASLTCTVGPFLAIVVTSLRGDSLSEGLLLFVTYALGMGAVVATAAVAVALAAGSVLGALRGSARWLPVVTGGLLVIVGAYVAYYGVWEVRVLGGADPADPIVDGALAIQQRLADLVRAVLP